MQKNKNKISKNKKKIKINEQFKSVFAKFYRNPESYAKNYTFYDYLDGPKISTFVYPNIKFSPASILIQEKKCKSNVIKSLPPQLLKIKENKNSFANQFKQAKENQLPNFNDLLVGDFDLNEQSCRLPITVENSHLLNQSNMILYKPGIYVSDSWCNTAEGVEDFPNTKIDMLTESSMNNDDIDDLLEKNIIKGINIIRTKEFFSEQSGTNVINQFKILLNDKLNVERMEMTDASMISMDYLDDDEDEYQNNKLQSEMIKEEKTPSKVKINDLNNTDFLYQNPQLMLILNELISRLHIEDTNRRISEIENIVRNVSDNMSIIKNMLTESSVQKKVETIVKKNSFKRNNTFIDITEINDIEEGGKPNLVLKDLSKIDIIFSDHNCYDTIPNSSTPLKIIQEESESIQMIESSLISEKLKNTNQNFSNGNCSQSFNESINMEQNITKYLFDFFILGAQFVMTKYLLNQNHTRRSIKWQEHYIYEYFIDYILSYSDIIKEILEMEMSEESVLEKRIWIRFIFLFKN